MWSCMYIHVTIGSVASSVGNAINTYKTDGKKWSNFKDVSGQR